MGGQEALIKCVIILILYIWIVHGGSISAMYDHYRWKYTAKPDPNATIIGINTAKEKLTKQNVKFRTTVEFSDGFYYVSYDTTTSRGLISYTISMDNDLRNRIIQKAVTAHNSEFQKKKIKKEPSPAVKAGVVVLRLFIIAILILYVFT